MENNEYIYVPDDEQVDLLMEDWLGNLREEGTYVHKNTVDAMTRHLEKDEALSAYALGDLRGLDPVEFARKARGIAQMTVDSMSPERIKVSVGGSQSCTDGKTVCVATDYLDDGRLSPGDKADLLIGFAAHEASHLLHSDFDGLDRQMARKGADEAKVWKVVSNIIEDERIEMRVGDEMPGIADYFGKVKKYAYEDYYRKLEKQGKLPTEKLPKFINTLLAAVRCPSLLSRDEVRDNYDSLCRIKDVLTPFPKTMKEVYRSTDRIIGIMKDLIEEDLKEQQKQNEGEDQGKGNQESQQENRPQDPSGKDVDQVFKDALGSKQMQEQLDAIEAELQKGTCDNVTNKTCNAALTSNERDYINDDAEKSGAAGGRVTYIRKRRGDMVRYQQSHDRVKQYVPAVRRALACRAQESDYALVGLPSGKLNGNKLVSLRTGNRNIFTKAGQVTTSGACVCVLIDESGSMSGAKESAARDAAVLINEAIKGIPNLEAFVYGFTTNQLNVYCERGETDRWGIGSTSSISGTPTGEAMRVAGERIKRLTRSNCLMLIITDGCPDDARKVQREEELLRNKGIVPVGIGISNSVMVNQLFKEAFAINDLSTMAQRLGQITRRYMDRLIVKTDSLS